MVVIASPVNTGRGNLSELNCSIIAYNFQTIYQALLTLEIPIVTTNYDLLIEEVSNKELSGITWKEKHKVSHLLRDGDKSVLHLHGKWDDPDSVILGIRSYQKVLNRRAYTIGDEGIGNDKESFVRWLW